VETFKNCETVAATCSAKTTKMRSCERMGANRIFWGSTKKIFAVLCKKIMNTGLYWLPALYPHPVNIYG
jgi:hypothetical protein